MTGYVQFFGDRPVVTPGKKAPTEPWVQSHQKCCVCGGRPCLRAVGWDGYCADHVREAFAAAKEKEATP